MWEREEDCGGGLEGVESGALPQGSVCKPLSTPPKLLSQRDLQDRSSVCSAAPSLRGWRDVYVRLAKTDLSALYITHAGKIFHSMLPIWAGQTRAGPSGGAANKRFPLVALCGCVCIHV